MSCTCLECNYTATTKSNFKAHLQSVKHINRESEYKKEKEKEVEDLKQQIIANDLLKDREIEDLKQQMYINDLLKDKEIDNLEQQIEDLKDKINILVEYKDDFKTVATASGSMAVSTINYIMNNYKTCPPLIEYELKDFPAIIDEKEVDFLNEVLYKHTKKILVQHLGDHIVSLYKKDDSKKQPVWTSDATRLNYIICAKINDKSKWVIDKGGIKTAKYIVKPILNYVLSLLTKKITDMPNLDQKQTTEQMNERNDKVKICLDIKRDINNSVLERDIVRYIAPSFALTSKQNEMLKLEA